MPHNAVINLHFQCVSVNETVLFFTSTKVSQYPNLTATRTRDGWQHRLIACLALRAAAVAVAALSLRRRRHPYSIRARAN